MATIRKATDAERAAYDAQTPKPLFPLYGFVRVDGRDLTIERCGYGYDDSNPKYEVMAPTGFHFDEGVHSLLCFTLDDVRERADQSLVPCTEACG